MARIDCKVVLLGSSYAGKTSLLERYLHDTFTEKTQATIGSAFAVKREVVGKTHVTLSCWDTAGSERYATMSRMYYRNARAAIVCYDITDRTSFERARSWVSELLQREENCRLYVCGTKLDIVTEDPSRRDTDRERAECLAHDEVFHSIAKDFTETKKGNSMRPKDFGESVKLTSWKKDGGCVTDKKSSCRCR